MMNLKKPIPACLTVSACFLLSTAAFGAGAPLYETDVRPILKAQCFHCHGEEEEIEGQLDLRLRRLILNGGDSGPAIVPGDAKGSLLLERIESGEMPPGKVNLSAKEIETIRSWIASGAKTARDEPEEFAADDFTYEERNFWSFQPIGKPDPPAVKETSRVRNPIDAFILAKLEEVGLTFAPDAERRTLIRRLSFDLIGLPPTPEEVDTFLADERPDAYERLVDRLLASPHYGERWGRHWLDVAGYADSEGFSEADTERESAWRYRDYVIRSMNNDKPFDQFIREQLAGDEMIAGPYKNMSAENVEKLTATGFLRMAPDGTGAGGVDQNLARNQVMAETLKIVSSSLMGMTVGCAECHSHRYDPIRHTDYYSMRAIFEPALDWKKWRAPKSRRISLYTDEDKRLAAEIEAKAKLVDDERVALTAKFIDQTLEAQLLKLEESVREPLRVAYKTAASKRTPEQKELLDKFPKILKISAGSLYLYDREIRVDAAEIDNERKKKEKEFVEQAQEIALSSLPEEERTAVRAALSKAESARTPEQKTLLGSHAKQIVTLANLKEFAPESAAEIERLKKAADDLRATQKADRIKEFQDKAAEIRNTKPKEGFVRALTEVAGQLPETHLFFRGDFEQPKEKLAPAGLSILDDYGLVSIPVNDSSLSTSGRRLAFAKRLTDGKHPLTARVLVNRFWLNHFGRGIVETPGDFGFLGARPTHPELLDWMASEFMSGGWKLKSFHKMLVTSTAYRQSSKRTETADEIDPDNKLYSHMSIRRLEAETLRDTILAVSGKLNRKMFGEPVPVMEDAVGQIILGKENLDGERKPLAAIDLQGEEYRRSLYIQVRRSRPLGVLAAFDMPEMEPNCTVRSSSTVTPQALMLMNSDFSTQFAGEFASRVEESFPNDFKKQCAQAWELAYCTPPSEQQIQRGVEYLTQQKEFYQQNPPAGIKATPDHLALTSFCQALMSSNAFLYVD